MKKIFLQGEGYVAPELEVISTVVEGGFGLSTGEDAFDAGLSDAVGHEYGSF